MTNKISKNEDMKEILQKAKTIAVVGCSDKPESYSFRIAKYLLDHGYKVIPVNPRLDSVLGQKAYPDLASIPEEVDIVDVFRNNKDVPPIIDAALARKCPVIWLQLGVECPQKRQAVENEGGKLIENKCIKLVHASTLLQ